MYVTCNAHVHVVSASGPCMSLLVYVPCNVVACSVLDFVIQVPTALWPRAHMYVYTCTLCCLGAHGLAYYTIASFPGSSQAFWLRIVYMYIVHCG